jgi:hypothetical protein
MQLYRREPLLTIAIKNLRDKVSEKVSALAVVGKVSFCCLLVGKVLLSGNFCMGNFRWGKIRGATFWQTVFVSGPSCISPS